MLPERRHIGGYRTEVRWTASSQVAFTLAMSRIRGKMLLKEE